MATPKRNLVFGNYTGTPAESESDDDSISISSTVVSEENPDETYIVENILAERYFSEEDRPRYLVKWEGYPIERCSWEPLEMFDDFNTINEWKEIQRKQRDANSEVEVFDWRKWDEDRLAERLDQEARKDRRERKRLKMARHARQGRKPRGNPRPGYRGYTKENGDFIASDNEPILEESDSDDPIAWRRKRRRVPTPESESDGNESVDSLMMEFKTQAAKSNSSGRAGNAIAKAQTKRPGERNARPEQEEIPSRKVAIPNQLYKQEG